MTNERLLGDLERPSKAVTDEIRDSVLEALGEDEAVHEVTADAFEDLAEDVSIVATAGDTEPAVSDVAEQVPDKQQEPKDLGGSTPEPNTYAKGGGTDVYGNPTRARKGSTRPADIESQVWSMMGPSKRAREIAKRVKLASEGKAASAQRAAAYTPAGSDAESEVSTAASITDLQYMAEIDQLVDDAMRFHESTNTAAAARCSVRDVTNAIAKRV